MAPLGEIKLSPISGWSVKLGCSGIREQDCVGDLMFALNFLHFIFSRLLIYFLRLAVLYSYFMRHLVW